MTKKCSRCKEAKDTNVFYKLKASEDHLDYLCQHGTRMDSVDLDDGIPVD